MMADIIRLRGSPHEQTQALLPWYVNNTLDEEERALVDAHLSECSECSSELEFERTLATEVASLPVDAERGWVAMADKLDAMPVDQGVAPVALLRRKITLGWAFAGQLAVAAALVLAVYVGRPGVPGPQDYVRGSPDYVGLGSNPSARQGNVLVLFNPETSEKDISAVLRRLQARVVDGPTESGAYVLNIADDRRQQAVQALRSSGRVLLAEPLQLETSQ